jgi:hypothetical protein
LSPFIVRPGQFPFVKAKIWLHRGIEHAANRSRRRRKLASPCMFLTPLLVSQAQMQK